MLFRNGSRYVRFDSAKRYRKITLYLWHHMTWYYTHDNVRRILDLGEDVFYLQSCGTYVYFWHRLKGIVRTANNLNYDPRTFKTSGFFSCSEVTRGLDYVDFSTIRKTPVLAAFWQSFTGSSPWSVCRYDDRTIFGVDPQAKPTELSVSLRLTVSTSCENTELLGMNLAKMFFCDFVIHKTNSLPQVAKLYTVYIYMYMYDI